MIRKRFCLLIPNVFRKGSVMAENDVAQLPGEGPLNKDLGKLLIIGHNILRFSVLHVHGGEGVLVSVAEHGDHAAAILIYVVGNGLIGKNEDAGCILQDWESRNGRGINAEFDEGFRGRDGGLLIIRGHFSFSFSVSK